MTSFPALGTGYGFGTDIVSSRIVTIFGGSNLLITRFTTRTTGVSGSGERSGSRGAAASGIARSEKARTAARARDMD
jgi:hypothetical protein